MVEGREDEPCMVGVSGKGWVTMWQGGRGEEPRGHKGTGGAQVFRGRHAQPKQRKQPLSHPALHIYQGSNSMESLGGKLVA